jgi:phenylalanyl-tRNA synthetase beta chain
MLGTDYSMETIVNVMQNLSFTINEIPYSDWDNPDPQLSTDSIIVSIPSYRQDITLEEDLIEEVARLEGYDSIPSTLPFSNAAGTLLHEQRQLEKLRDLNVGFGLHETVNYSFISREEATKLLTNEDHPWRQPLALANPLTEEQSVMRLSLLPGLLNCAHRNINRRNLNLALFEVGSVYIPNTTDPNSNQPSEEATWGLLLCGLAPASWQTQSRIYDYFYAKGLIETIAAAFNINPFSFERTQADLYPFLHPGRSAIILIEGITLGYLGELNPQAAANYDLPTGTVVAELRLAQLFAAARQPFSSGLPKFPAIERDIALVGSADIPAANIDYTIRSAGSSLLEHIKLFDMYDGPPIIKGQRSLAYALSFRAAERTLTDMEVDRIIQSIIDELTKKYQIKLR